jgi:hypothetical protein
MANNNTSATPNTNNAVFIDGLGMYPKPRVGDSVIVRGQNMTVYTIEGAGTIVVRSENDRYYRVSGLFY